MAIRAGQFVHDAQGFVIQRIQTGGVSNLNIGRTQVYELGDYNTVGNVFDIPDLSFDIDSYDVSCDVEALIHGVAPTSVVNNQAFTFGTVYPIDVISPFRAGNGLFNITNGIVVPYLTLDTVAYSFGVKANAQETFTFKGDAVYYTPGSPYYEEKTLVAATFTYNLGHTAHNYTESGITQHVLSACVVNTSTGAYQRLFYSTDGSATAYTDSTTTITTNTDWQAAGYTKLKVTYSSATAATYPQSVSALSTTTPAAVRSKDILLYVGNASSATSALTRWKGVQSFKVTRKVNLTQTEELGNSHYVSSDYTSADVSGQIAVRPADVSAFMTLVQQIGGATSTTVTGAVNQPLMEIMLQVRDPVTGFILKTFNIPDAQFTLPAASGKANTNLDVNFDFFSSQGILTVYRG